MQVACCCSILHQPYQAPGAKVLPMFRPDTLCFHCLDIFEEAGFSAGGLTAAPRYSVCNGKNGKSYSTLSEPTYSNMVMVRNGCTMLHCDTTSTMLRLEDLQ